MENFFESIGPLFILALWTIFSLLARKAAASKKNKKNAPHDNPSAPRPKKAAAGNDKDTKKPVFGKLEDSVETILKELDILKKEETPKDKIPEKKKNIKKTRIAQNKKENQSQTASFDTKFSEPLRERRTKPQTDSIPVSEPYSRQKNQFAFSTQKLRNAVIWTEILGKPVSERNE